MTSCHYSSTHLHNFQFPATNNPNSTFRPATLWRFCSTNNKACGVNVFNTAKYPWNTQHFVRFFPESKVIWLRKVHVARLIIFVRRNCRVGYDTGWFTNYGLKCNSLFCTSLFIKTSSTSVYPLLSSYDAIDCCVQDGLLENLFEAHYCLNYTKSVSLC